jgi:uncharacterized Zn finger protein
MIQLTTAATLEKAINKARTVKPRVHVNRFGSYTVECMKREGKRFASCSCVAGERGKACYHVAAAVAAHIQLATERAQLNF